MKKIAMALLAPVIIISCGKVKSAKQMAEDVCECSKKANALPTTDPNRSSAQQDCQVRQQDAWDRVKDNNEKSREFNAVLSKCASEQIKQSFGQ